ncbi:MAG: PQQ-binding-like beta-propeller repeat protein [Haloarculaceae archaeon]
MRRRTLLRSAPLAALGLAGCLDRSAGTTESSTAWSASVPGPVVHEPAVADGAVVVGTDAGTVHALAAGDGHRRWDADVGRPAAGAPLVDAGTAFVVGGEQGLGDEQRVVALDPATGEERWSFDAGGWWLALHGADDRSVYISTRDDALGPAGQTLFAVDRTDGTARWQVPVGDSRGAAVTGETLALATFGRLYAVDLTDGRQRWTVDAEDVDDPRAAAGTVLARVGGAGDTAVRAYDARSGAARWTFDGQSVASLSLADAAYAGGRRLVRLPLVSGDPDWRASGPSFVPGAPVADGRVFAGGDRAGAYATADGEGLWTFDPSRATATGATGGSAEPVPELLVPEVATGGAVFVRGAGGDASRRRAYALGQADGATRWSFVADGTLTALAAGDGRAYAGSAAGAVHAFGASGAD